VVTADTFNVTDSGTSDGPTCDANPCPVATGLNLPQGITADSMNVYWAEFGDNASSTNGAIKGCPLAGCGSSGPTVYASAQSAPNGIVSDGQTIYWGNYGGGGIFACSVTGCSNSPRTVAANAASPWGLAIDATYVYWVSQSDQSLHRALRSVADGGDTVLWDGASPFGFFSTYVAVDDAAAYVIDDHSDLFKIPLGAGNVVPLFVDDAGGGGNWNVAMDPGGLLFGDTNGLITRADKTTGAATQLVSMLHSPTAVVVDPASGDIYWADLGGGSGTDGIIGRAHADGSMKTPLASSQQSPVAIAVQGGSVYWTNRGTWDATAGAYLNNTGAVFSTPK
jgi:hypothetical protein